MSVSSIDEYELRKRREKRREHYQIYQAIIDVMNSGNVDKSNLVTTVAELSQFNGRCVSVRNTNSQTEDSDRYPSHLSSIAEDLLRKNFVNTAKKTEKPLSDRTKAKSNSNNTSNSLAGIFANHIC